MKYARFLFIVVILVAAIFASVAHAPTGASSPISSSGENLDSDARAKATNAAKAAIREFVEPRGAEALALAEAMIDKAKAATANEALEAHLVDFVVDNIDDLLESLDGFTV